MQSNWKLFKEMIILIIAIYINCISSKSIVTKNLSKTEIKTSCDYAQNLNNYHVDGYYKPNTDIESTVTNKKDGTAQLGNYDFQLTPGDNILLLISGLYKSQPKNRSDIIQNAFSSIYILDSLYFNDAIPLKMGVNCLLFMYSNSSWFYKECGEVISINGHIILNSLNNDTLTGIIHFSGETNGFYHDCNVSDDSVSGEISGNISFAAERKWWSKIEIKGNPYIPFDKNENALD